MSDPKFTVTSGGILRADVEDIVNSDAAQRQIKAVERLSQEHKQARYEDYERLSRENEALRQRNITMNKSLSDILEILRSL